MKAQSWSFLRCLFSSENSRKATLNNIIQVLKSVVNTVSKYANLATELERQLTKGKRAERTKHNFRSPICRSAIGQASCLICARRCVVN